MSRSGEKEEHSKVFDDLMVELIDDVACGLCFEVHRACKLGTFLLDETDYESQKQFEIVNEIGVDVFGQLPAKKQYECICPNCDRNLAASRFAPHLEKCMGMGRNSSRIASRRIATNTGKKTSDVESDDNDDENDLSYWPDHKARKLRKDKNSVQSKKSSKLKANDKRKKVVSEQTKKIPGRSSASSSSSRACLPDGQRTTSSSIKQILFSQQSSSRENDDGRLIDIDSYDADGHPLNLWDSASNASPADSISTGNS